MFVTIEREVRRKRPIISMTFPKRKRISVSVQGERPRIASMLIEWVLHGRGVVMRWQGGGRVRKASREAGVMHHWEATSYNVRSIWKIEQYPQSRPAAGTALEAPLHPSPVPARASSWLPSSGLGLKLEGITLNRGSRTLPTI